MQENVLTARFGTTLATTARSAVSGVAECCEICHKPPNTMQEKRDPGIKHVRIVFSQGLVFCVMQELCKLQGQFNEGLVTCFP